MILNHEFIEVLKSHTFCKLINNYRYKNVDNKWILIRMKMRCRLKFYPTMNNNLGNEPMYLM